MHRAGSPPGQEAEGSYGGQDVRAGCTGRGSANPGGRVRPTRARRSFKEAHRKQPDLRIEFRFFAGRQEGRGAFGKDAGPDKRILAKRPGRVLPRTARDDSAQDARSMQDGIAKKNGGRRRQQQATAGTVSGETRINRIGNGYCPCLKEKHSPHRTQGSGPTTQHRDNAPDPCRRAGSFPGQEGPPYFSSSMTQNHPLIDSDSGVFCVCVWASPGRAGARPVLGRPTLISAVAFDVSP